MQLDGYNSYSLVQARDLFAYAQVGELRVSYENGSFFLSLPCRYSYGGYRPIRTQRYERKEYRTMKAIISDYEYITGNKFEGFTIPLPVKTQAGVVSDSQF